MNEILQKLNEETICTNIIRDPNNGNGYCRYLTNKVGRLFSLNKRLCNLDCPRFGPKNGQCCNDEQKFLNLAFTSFSPVHIMLVEKLLTNYSLPTDIIIPNEWDEIKNSLFFLKQYSGFKQFLITGSAITKNAKRPLKDLDIVLWFNNIEEYLEKQISSLLPPKIGGITVDYFICIGEEDQIPNLYFVSLDIKNKTLYTSSWFKLKIKSVPDGVKVIESSYKHFDDMLKKMLVDRQSRRPETKSSWTNVRLDFVCGLS